MSSLKCRFVYSVVALFGVALLGVAQAQLVDTTSGDAVAAELLTGKKAWVDGREVSGTMPNHAAVVVKPGVAQQAIPAGFHTGAGHVVGDPGLATGNIRTGVTIFGVPGKAEVVDTTTGDATAVELLLGKKSWVDGKEITGTMPNHAAAVLKAAPANQPIPAGFYNGAGYVEGDPDLVTGNIRAGVNIFGVAGKAEVVDTTTGDATAVELLLGKKSWVDGKEITGTMPNHAAAVLKAAPANQPIPAGFYNGAGYVEGDPDLVTGNVRAGVNLFGVAGKAEVVDTTTGDATAVELLLSKKSWVDGKEITGTMPNNAAVIMKPGIANQPIVAGFHNGSGHVVGDAALVTANIRAGVSVFGIPGKVEVVDTTTGDATAAEVLLSKKSWVDGKEITGTMPNNAAVIMKPGIANQPIAAGFHDGKGHVVGDAALVTANIRAGVSVFGVAGKAEVVDTTSGDAIAGELMLNKKAWVDGKEIVGTLVTQTLSPDTSVLKAGNYVETDLVTIDKDLLAMNIVSGVSIFGVVGTANTNIISGRVHRSGQTSAKLAGDDGSAQKGIPWPNPRFTLGEGEAENCVTDNLTGLVWLRNPIASRTWDKAIAYCEELDGTSGRGGHTDWRMPNVRELQSLVHYGFYDPAMSNTAGTGQMTKGDPFSAPLGAGYWSSTTGANDAELAWYMRLRDGGVFLGDKSSPLFVWAVRGR